MLDVKPHLHVPKRSYHIINNRKYQNIADMPCNPSIGGSAKGIVVREIDALGGYMGYNADISHLQIKMLNSKKGPGVRSLRCQADKTTYPENMLKELLNTPNLTIKEDLVKELIIENNEVQGIITETNEKYQQKNNNNNRYISKCGYFKRTQ